MKFAGGMRLGALAALILAPTVLGEFYLGLLTKGLIFAILAMALNLVLGFGGLPSLGHAAFFGTSGYTVAILSERLALNLWLAGLTGIAVSLVVAVVMGALALRSRGVYFMLLTLAISQVLWAFAFSARGLTGGEDGMVGIERLDLSFLPIESSTAFYLLVLTAVASTAGVITIVVKSPFGLVLRGARENERRARALGYRVGAFHLVAFAISGVLAGLAGVLFTYANGFVTPSQLGVLTSAEAFLMVLIGGASTVLGPAIGAVVLTVMEDIVSSYFSHWGLVIGLVFVLIVLFARRGLYIVVRERLGVSGRAA